MPVSHSEFLAMQERCERGMKKPKAPPEFIASEQEVGHGGLQQQIQEWCDAQWPKWVYDFPRTDKPSTLPTGRHDATVWGPYPKCFLIETKAKGKKQDHDQLVWATRMRALGWTVEVVYSLEQFKALVATEFPKTPPPSP